MIKNWSGHSFSRIEESRQKSNGRIRIYKYKIEYCKDILMILFTKLIII
jgi:hypothetical protein